MMTDSVTKQQVNMGVYPHYDGQWEPYHILGVPPNASLAEIKLAYRKLALQCHPDKVTGDDLIKAQAHDQFAKLSAAYETLTRPASNEQVANQNPILYGPILSDPYELFRNTFSAEPPMAIDTPGHGLFPSWSVDEGRGTPSKIAGYLTNGPSIEPAIPSKVQAEESTHKRSLTEETIVPIAPARKRARVVTEPPAPQPTFGWNSQPTFSFHKRHANEMTVNPEGFAHQAFKRQRMVCM